MTLFFVFVDFLCMNNVQIRSARICGVGRNLGKMRKVELNGCVLILMLLGVVVCGKAEVYIVTIEGEPVISYRGGVNGYEATAVDSDSDEKIDVTRCF